VNILIVEDEKVTRKRLQRFVESWGHSVIASADGSEGLEAYLSNPVDIVITDWMMPEIDGIELTRHLRSRRNEDPYVYVILLTTRSEKADTVEALDTGVDDYIVKPFDPGELRARITVGERTVRLERALREYSEGLEKIVRRQTAVIRKTQEETIIRLLSALESRDEETGGHVSRIGLFSAKLAELAGWASETVTDLRLAAPMHDIGKIGVPDAILLKRGRLTAQEFDIIKSHTTIGAQILQNSQFPMLRMAHDIALSHHEKWDGSGYPKGLAGEDIAEVGRIVALVDVFDALSRDRIYRKASPLDEVLQMMAEARGSHFDPYFYDLFMESLDAFLKIAEENP
jgi:putative two-component system response regulator